MKLRDMSKLLFVCLLVFLAACDKKDPIYNTPHPSHAMVTLTTEWSNIGEGLTAPDAYTVTAAFNSSTTAGYTATLTGVTNKLDHLFEPGNYRFYVYNTPEQVSVNGTVMSVVAEAVSPTEAGRMTSGASSVDQPERFVHPAPGWLFAKALEADLKADTEHTLTASMQQQMRQLTLIIDLRDVTTDEVTSVTGTLSGVAGTLDIADGTHDAPSHVALTFSKITSGTDAGKWSATARLLGITGAEQRLAGTITFAGGNLTYIFLDSDLTKPLATFNANKHQPMMLGGSAVEATTEMGLGATITDWIPVNR